MGDDFGHAADPRPDYRQPGGHRLQQRVGEAFPPAGQQEQVSGGQVRPDLARKR
jgi:hypothetical protein